MVQQSILAQHQKRISEDHYLTAANLATTTQAWLQDLSGYRRRLKWFPFDPYRSALLVIDMQKFFLSPASHAYLPAGTAVLGNIRQLIEAFRSAKRPVVFTRHAYLPDEDPGIMDQWWGDNIIEGTGEAELIDDLQPQPGELVLRKTRYSAFHRTELEQWLREREVKSIVVTGVMTHLCCGSTAREGFMRDFAVYFVIDGTATQNELFHLGAILSLSHGFVLPVAARELVEVFEQGRGAREQGSKGAREPGTKEMGTS